MEDTAYYLSFLITFSLCFFAMILFRNKQKSSAMSCQKAKLIYSILVVIIGLLSGTVFFHSLNWIFSLFGHVANVGHGEVFASVVLVNFLLSLLWVAIGRVVICWQKQTW
jgi:hypothetical protein